MSSHLAIRLPERLPELVLATPVLDAAQAACREEGVRTSAERPPWRRVTLLVPQALRDLLEVEPDLGRSFGGAELVSIGVAREERAAIERCAPDAILLLDHGFASARWAWQAGVPLRAGLARGMRRLLLTHSVVPPTQGGHSLPVSSAHLARDLGSLIDLRPTGLEPRLDVREESRASLVVRLRENDLEPGTPFGIVAPAAGLGASDLWPPDRWADLLGAMALRWGWQPVILTLHESELPVARAILAAASGGPAAARGELLHVHLEAGELDLLPPLIEGASAVIGGHFGPQAVAAAFGVPSVSLVGAHHGSELLPPTSRAVLVRGPALDCAPCLESRCPLGHRDCMHAIGVSDVMGNLDEILRQIEEEQAAEAFA